MTSDRASDSILSLIGPDAYLALVEHLGGQRVYVPKDRLGRIAEVVGDEAAAKLAARMGGEYLPVPLARDFRAAQYRAAGDSNPAIAAKLGVTVRAVERLFSRTPSARPAKARKIDPRQTDLFG